MHNIHTYKCKNKKKYIFISFFLERKEKKRKIKISKLLYQMCELYFCLVDLYRYTDTHYS